ncbi:hypothetical protein [Brevundimonas lenta]|uniref:Uncharacterized protein n=1 Tax=Brevundimonas lenta TaxID=424796 RepID=A0A7W6JCM2_9CAUL|nr:hypothetical protein [Brevundimonas lenta]MBB4082586.1 hypothetical protein [Brevundimonas lenta]
MSEFEFFFTFYGLVLGLAAAKVLKGVGGLVQARRLKHVGLQTGLLMLFLMLSICVAWVSAWTNMHEVEIRLGVLAAPLGIAGCYYLAAVIVVPKDMDHWDSLDAYFAGRKRFVAVLLLAAEVLIDVTAWNQFRRAMTDEPDLFWRWLLPYNAVTIGLLVALVFVRGKRWNIAVLSALMVLFTLPYWTGRYVAGL